MSVIGSNILAGASGQGGVYTIDRSLRFRSSASAYLSRTFTTPTDNKKWTMSLWCKRGDLGTWRGLFAAGNTGGVITKAEFFTDDLLYLNSWNGSSNFQLLVTSQVFRDSSAWYHLVFVYDFANATPNNRARIYLNGDEITSFSSRTNPSTTDTSYWNNASYSQEIGKSYQTATTSSKYFDGYLTEINFIDGQALDPTSFGEYNSDTGVWQPKKYGGAYGTNGFYLNFSDNSTTTTLGYDTSGQGNNWTANNISVTSGVTYDSMTDVPTLTSEDAANYAVLNVVAKSWSNSGTGTTSNGNLQIAYSSGNWYGHKSTIAVTSGKWYYEVTNVSAGIYVACGISLVTVGAEYSSGIYKYRSNAEIYNTSYASYGATWSTAGDVCGVAFDLDAGTITFYKNGVSQGTAFTGIPTGVYAAEVIVASGTAVANFGQRPFAYTPPTGFKSLNTYNLPDSTIVDGSQYFNTVLYTGNNTTGHAITGVGFQPDFVWIKDRDSAYANQLFDSVRGATKALFSNLTNDENTDTEKLQSFDSDGFTYGTNIGGNLSPDAYVAWNWKANGSGVSNNDGSIASTVSANPTAGFSIVTYTGTGANATVGHGLNDAPKMVIVKQRDTGTVTDWYVYHPGLTSAANFIRLNLANGQGTNASVWNSTAPTSSVINLGSYTETNASTKTYVAYCFADIEGYSKFGVYSGNSSPDGTFVYLGFRARFLLVKGIGSGGSGWLLYDTERRNYNQNTLDLRADLPNTEPVSSGPFDFLSNGFKLRGTDTNSNSSSTTYGPYIYMAFAENPFKNALAR